MPKKEAAEKTEVAVSLGPQKNEGEQVRLPALTSLPPASRHDSSESWLHCADLQTMCQHGWD